MVSIPAANSPPFPYRPDIYNCSFTGASVQSLGARDTNQPFERVSKEQSLGEDSLFAVLFFFRQFLFCRIFSLAV